MTAYGLSKDTGIQSDLRKTHPQTIEPTATQIYTRNQYKPFLIIAGKIRRCLANLTSSMVSQIQIVLKIIVVECYLAHMRLCL